MKMYIKPQTQTIALPSEVTMLDASGEVPTPPHPAPGRVIKETSTDIGAF